VPGLKDAIDVASWEKYNTPVSLRYYRDLSRERSRATRAEYADFFCGNPQRSIYHSNRKVACNCRGRKA